MLFTKNHPCPRCGRLVRISATVVCVRGQASKEEIASFMAGVTCPCPKPPPPPRVPRPNGGKLAGLLGDE